MLPRPLIAVLWATASVVAAPTIERRSNSAASFLSNSSGVDPQNHGSDVVIVYAQPEDGCPADKQCGLDHISQDPGVTSSAPVAATSPTPSPTQEPTFSQSGTNVQLPPNVHWSVDTSSPANVIPVPANSGSQLYYGHTDPSQAGYFAFMTYYFISPSVNLDHCDHITSIVCSATGCTISFSSSEAYQHAINQWSTEIILIVYTDGCSAYADGERCYLKVTALEFKDGLVIDARGTFAHPDSLIAMGETEWGWWTPRNGGPSRSSSGGSGPDVNWSGSSSGSGSGSGSSGAGQEPSGSSTAASNDTSSFSDPKTACVPPVDTKYGLPTACLGDLFDQDLDDGLGYPDDGGAAFDDFINAVAPGLEDYTSAPDSSDDDLSSWISEDRRSLSRRATTIEKRFCIKCAFKSIVHAVTHPAETVDALKTVVQQATSISGSVDKDLSFKVPDPSSAEGSKLQDPNAKQVTSPWGDSILLKAFGTQGENEERDGSDEKLSGYMNIFCVGCGVSGHANVAGRATWTPFGGFTQGQLEMRTDIQFVFKLGIDAQMTYHDEFNNNLLRLGLPGLTYGVVTIGPWIEVGSHVTLDAEAKGRLLAGAEMGLQDAHVLIDFINPSNSTKDGWDPYFKPVFEADGEIMLSASLGLPVAVKCGIQVSSLSKTVGLIDEPSITGTAQVAASIGLTESGSFAAGFKDNDGCTGISTQISWRNKLFIDVLGLTTLPLLDTQDKPLDRGCIKLPGLPSTSTGTTAIPSPTGTSADSTDQATTTTEPATFSTDGTTTTFSTDGTTTTFSTDGTTTTFSTDGTTTTGDREATPTDDISTQQTSTPDSPADAANALSEAPTGDSSSTGDAPTEDTPGASANRSIAGHIVSPASNNAANSNTVLDLTSQIDSNTTTLTYEATSLPSDPYNCTNGYEYDLLTVSDASIIFLSCGNGGVYAVSPGGPDNPACNSMWKIYEDVIVADAADRVLHYYNNTMSTVGVSRLRVSDSDGLPETGVLVALAADDSDEGYYFAVDSDLGVFYPVLCTYSDSSPAKMFLAADPDAGLQMLQSVDLEYSVTGGKVDKCYVMPLLMGQYQEDEYDSYDDSDSSDALDFDEGNGEEVQE